VGQRSSERKRDPYYPRTRHPQLGSRCRKVTRRRLMPPVTSEKQENALKT
jgi:hypothetical protein